MTALLAGLDKAPANRSLYDIEADLERLEAVLEQVDDDGNPVFSEDEKVAAVDAYLDGAGELKAKLDSYGALIKVREALGKSRKEEADRIAALAKGDSTFVVRFKERLRLFMRRHELKKLESFRFVFNRQNNGGVRALTVTVEPDQLPERYQQTKIVANEDLLRVDALIASDAKEIIDEIKAIEVDKRTPAQKQQLIDAEKRYQEFNIPGVVLEPRGEHVRVK